jgi:hypothetical protein
VTFFAVRTPLEFLRSEISPGKPTDPVFPGIAWEKLARVFREHCEAVGIDRARLFEKRANKLRLRAARHHLQRLAYGSLGLHRQHRDFGERHAGDSHRRTRAQPALPEEKPLGPQPLTCRELARTQAARSPQLYALLPEPLVSPLSNRTAGDVVTTAGGGQFEFGARCAPQSSAPASANIGIARSRSFTAASAIRCQTGNRQATYAASTTPTTAEPSKRKRPVRMMASVRWAEGVVSRRRVGGPTDQGARRRCRSRDDPARERGRR